MGRFHAQPGDECFATSVALEVVAGDHGTKLACRISVAGLNPLTATGHHYTSRFTAGDMDFTLLNRSSDYGTFAEVQAADPEHSTS